MDGPKLRYTGISNFNTYEGSIIHEWMHNNIAAGFFEQIIDVSGNWQGSPQSAQKIYGSDFCYLFAWKWVNRGSKYVNTKTAWNADNYVWFFIYNWFSEHWSWNADGSQATKRSLSERQDDHSVVTMDDDENVKNENDIDDTRVPGPINCGDPQNPAPIEQYECDYMGEDYATYLVEAEG